MSESVAESGTRRSRSIVVTLLGSAAVSLAVCALAAASPSERVDPGRSLATSHGSVAMLCFGHGNYVKRFAPRACAVLGRARGRDCDCDGVDLVRISWSHWGRAVARGKGTEKTLHPHQFGSHSFHVRLKAWRLRKGRCGPVYTRLTETSPPHRRHTLVLATCPRPVL